MDKTKRGIGYLINIGVTTCRLFRVNDDNSLKEDRVISYQASPSSENYFDEIITNIQDLVKTFPDSFLVKVIVDSKFADLFQSETDLKDFIREFYVKTNLYFNILTPEQTVRNLSQLFGDLSSDTAIINIGRNYVDIMTLTAAGKLDSTSLTYSLTDVQVLVNSKKMHEVLTEENIEYLKNQIKRRIKSGLQGIKVGKAIIIKDELSFMQEFNYPLVHNPNESIKEHQYIINFENYKKANHEKLFTVNFREELLSRGFDESKQKRIYGFKFGHLLLETIFELLNVKLIIPSDLLNIHGSINSYIYNVVLSGSTQPSHVKYFAEAAKLIEQLGAKITSPQFDKEDQLFPITTKSEYAHLKAIDDCDILFVCNKDGYIGRSTACEIYYASALRKTIVFWTDPQDEQSNKDEDRLYCIPHEHWNHIKIVGV